MFGSRKYTVSISKIIENSKGEGGRVSKLLKQSMRLSWNFQMGGVG